MRQLLTALSANPELARWLGQTSLIRTVTVVTINVATGESLLDMVGHGNLVRDVEFGVDGRTVITASADHTGIGSSLR